MKKIIYFLFLLLLLNSISSHIYGADCEKQSMPSNEEWKLWIDEMKELAIDQGISNKTINYELDRVQPAKKIILRDRCQVESKITLDEYLYYRLDKARIVRGKSMLKTHQKDLDLIGDFFDIMEKIKVKYILLKLLQHLHMTEEEVNSIKNN